MAASAGSRMKYFVILMAIAAVLFFGAFMFLPVILLVPQKFALMFSLGSICMHAAMSYLKSSPMEYMWHLLRERFWVTSIYIFCLLYTIYAAVVLGSYIWVVIAAGG